MTVASPRNPSVADCIVRSAHGGWCPRSDGKQKQQRPSLPVLHFIITYHPRRDKSSQSMYELPDSQYYDMHMLNQLLPSLSPFFKNKTTQWNQTPIRVLNQIKLRQLENFVRIRLCCKYDLILFQSWVWTVLNFIYFSIRSHYAKDAYVLFTWAVSSSYSRQPTPSKRSKSIQPFHRTQTPFMIKWDLRWTCKFIKIFYCTQEHITFWGNWLGRNEAFFEGHRSKAQVPVTIILLLLHLLVYGTPQLCTFYDEKPNSFRNLYCPSSSRHSVQSSYSILLIMGFGAQNSHM